MPEEPRSVGASQVTVIWPGPVWTARTLRGADGGLCAGAVAVATVSVAVSLAALPVLLVNTARYWLPVSPLLTGPVVRVEDVAPGTSVKLWPPSVLTCHCTVGV